MIENYNFEPHFELKDSNNTARTENARKTGGTGNSDPFRRPLLSTFVIPLGFGLENVALYGRDTARSLISPLKQGAFIIAPSKLN